MIIGALLSSATVALIANGGPCTAARVLAGSSFYRGPKRFITLSAFTFGAFAADVALVSSLALFFRVLEFSSWLYAFAAATALIAGFWSITRPIDRRCAVPHGNAGAGEKSMLAVPVVAGMGSSLLLGACCAPFALAAAATGGRGASPLAVAIAYAAAHAAVPLAATVISRAFVSVKVDRGFREATIVIQSGLFFGCAVYFGMLS